MGVGFDLFEIEGLCFFDTIVSLFDLEMCYFMQSGIFV